MYLNFLAPLTDCITFIVDHIVDHCPFAVFSLSPLRQGSSQVFTHLLENISELSCALGVLTPELCPGSRWHGWAASPCPGEERSCWAASARVLLAGHGKWVLTSPWGLWAAPGMLHHSWDLHEQRGFGALERVQGRTPEMGWKYWEGAEVCLARGTEGKGRT